MKYFVRFILITALTFQTVTSFPLPADTPSIKLKQDVEFNREAGRKLREAEEALQNRNLDLALKKTDQLLAEYYELPKLHLLKAKIIKEDSTVQKGIDYLTEIIRSNPDNPGFLAARAQFLTLNNYLLSAREDFYSVYERDYRPVEVLTVLSDIEQERGNLQEAAELMEQAISLSPEDDALWFRKARLDLKRRDISEAGKSCSKAIALNPDHLDYLKLYTEILIYLKKKAELEQHVLEVYRKYPENAWVALRYSTLIIEKGDIDRAKEVLFRALEANPTDKLLLFQLGTIYSAEKEWEKAETYFIRGLESDPNSTWAMIQLSKVYLQAGKIEDAVIYLEQARAEETTDSFVYETLARIYNRKNDTFEAERVILDGLAIDDENKTLILEYANILEKRGKEKETTKAYEEALQQDPDNPYILGKLGNLYRAAGKYEIALEVLEKAIGLSSKSTWIRAYYIETLSDMESWQAALNEIEELLKIMPDDYWAYAKKAMILFETGKLEAALDSIHTSIRLRADARWLKEIEGRILEGLKRYQEAETAFKEMLETSPENTYVLMRLAYVQVHTDKKEALKAIRESLNLDDFDLRTIELYLYLTDRASEYWGFTPGSLEYETYESIVKKQSAKVETGLDRLEREGSVHVPFLRYYNNLLRGERDPKNRVSLNVEDADTKWHFYYLGVDSLRNENFEQAKKYMEKALALSDQNPWIMVKLGYVYQQLKQHEKAVDYLNKFLQQKDDNEYLWVRLRLALNYDLARQYRKSEREYKRILEKRPDDNVALNNLAWMYLNARDEELHKLDEALDLAMRAVNLQPSSANLDTLAEAYYQKGEYEKALRAIEKALDKDRSGIDDFKKTKKKILRAMESQQNQ